MDGFAREGEEGGERLMWERVGISAMDLGVAAWEGGK